MMESEQTTDPEIAVISVVHSWPVSIPPSSLPADVLQRVRGLERQADWDGEGAEAITREACNHAIQFLERLPRHVQTPRISPSALGSVSFYWARDGVRLLVEVTGADDIYFQEAGPGACRDRGSLSQEEMIRKLTRLFRSES